MSFNSDVQKFVKDTVKKLERQRDTKSLRALGAFALDLIRDRTREGFGVKKVGGNRVGLKPLSPKYIEARKKMRLSPATSPSTSNLTRTGSMLDTLKVTVAGGKLTIVPSGRDREGVSNLKKTEWQEDQGRVYLRLSKVELGEVARFYQKEILDRNFK